MATSKRRSDLRYVKRRSDLRNVKWRSDIRNVALVCFATIHFWSIFNVLREVPAWVRRMSFWDFVGTIAYTQVFAVGEALLVTLLVLLAARLLIWRRDASLLLPMSTAIILPAALISASMHIFIHRLRLWGRAQFGVTLLLALILYAVFLWAVLHRPAVRAKVDAFARRLTSLAWLYIVIDAVSIIIVGVRLFI